MNDFEIRLRDIVNRIDGFQYDEIINLNKYPMEISEKVLIVLIEFACLGQNLAPIKLGREKIGEIDKVWLLEHFIEVSKKCINFNDEWEYRRLVEVVVEMIPQLKNDILEIGKNSSNPEIIEVVEDYL